MSGYIDWEEFLVALSILKSGKEDEKIEFFFTMYDEDHSGGLSFEEIKEVGV